MGLPVVSLVSRVSKNDHAPSSPLTVAAADPGWLGVVEKPWGLRVPNDPVRVGEERPASPGPARPRDGRRITVKGSFHLTRISLSS